MDTKFCSFCGDLCANFAKTKSRWNIRLSIDNAGN
jgi:hypothetical protein